VGLKMKKCAIKNCWISARGAIKLHHFDTTAEQIKAHVPKGCNFIAPQALFHYPAIVLLVLYYFIA